jgi:hypothetical protein
LRNLLRCRRGTAAFVTVVALVPLIGVVALGGEAGSWYVTKQHAQNAADAAAYSGALRVACSTPGSCDTAQDYVYRGKQFAAQNAFCNAGESYPGSNCATSLPAGTTQSVQIDQPTSSRVRAIVGQHQPGYLSKVLGLVPDGVDIRAQAIAEVQKPKDLCMLGLGPSGNALTIGGSSTITGNNCALMSNNTVKYNSDPTFSGSGMAVNAVSGCVASVGHCDVGVTYNYNMLPAWNPLNVLDNQSFNSWTSTGKPNDLACSGTLTPNGSANLYRNLTCNNGDTVIFSAGTYYFYNATITINGGANVSGTGVTLVLLGDSNLKINGGTVNLSAPNDPTSTNPLNGVLIDDQAPNKSANKVIVNGGGTVTLDGTMYFPNVDVTWGGTTGTSTTCSAVYANTLTITGNAYLNTGNCVQTTIAKTQVVALVQ